MSYTALINHNGELKVCYNEENKPKDGPWYVKPSYESVRKEWQSKHQYIEFFDKKNEEKVVSYILQGIAKRKGVALMFVTEYSQAFTEPLKTGIETDCIEITDYYLGKYAFFKQEETQDELFKQLIDVFDAADKNSEGYATLINEAKKQFIITKK